MLENARRAPPLQQSDPASQNAERPSRAPKLHLEYLLLRLMAHRSNAPIWSHPETRTKLSAATAVSLLKRALKQGFASSVDDYLIEGLLAPYACFESGYSVGEGDG